MLQRDLQKIVNGRNELEYDARGLLARLALRTAGVSGVRVSPVRRAALKLQHGQRTSSRDRVLDNVVALSELDLLGLRAARVDDLALLPSLRVRMPSAVVSERRSRVQFPTRARRTSADVCLRERLWWPCCE